MMVKPTTSNRSRFGARTLLAAVCGVLTLSACSPNLPEIEEWMERVRISTQPVQSRLEEPKRFEPFRYTREAAISPFSDGKLASLQDPLQVRAKGGLAPDINRRREVLESYPVEQIKMVGFLRSKAENTALLQVEKTVHIARVGNYAGLNFGRITGINETEVALKELVQDAAGDWVERETAIKLQETGQ